MKLIKLSNWFNGKCKVNFSMEQIIRINHLGKKDILIDDEFTNNSINLYYRSIHFANLLFNDNFDPEEPKLRLNIHTLNKELKLSDQVKHDYQLLIKRFNDTYTDFTDIEFYIDMLITCIKPISDASYNRECYGKEEILMNQRLLRDDKGRLTGIDANYKVSKPIGYNILKFGLLNIYDNKCMVCKTSNHSLVDICHIKPWSESNDDKYERTDINNGIILCKNHRALFESGYFTIDGGLIIISKDVSNEDKDMFFRGHNSHIQPRSESQIYLDWHKKCVFRG